MVNGIYSKTKKSHFPKSLTLRNTYLNSKFFSQKNKFKLNLSRSEFPIKSYSGKLNLNPNPLKFIRIVVEHTISFYFYSNNKGEFLF